MRRTRHTHTHTHTHTHNILCVKSMLFRTYSWNLVSSHLSGIPTNHSWPSFQPSMRPGSLRACSQLFQKHHILLPSSFFQISVLNLIYSHMTGWLRGLAQCPSKELLLEDVWKEIVGKRLVQNWTRGCTVLRGSCISVVLVGSVGLGGCVGGVVVILV